MNNILTQQSREALKKKCDDFLSSAPASTTRVSVILTLDGQDVKYSVSIPLKFIRYYRWDIIARGIEIIEETLGYPIIGQKIDFRFEPYSISLVNGGSDGP